MLTDQKPVDIKGVDGVIVYADATSPLIFYYASTTPQISGAGAEAAFNLMRFDPGTEESAGHLSLLVDLALPAAKLASLQTELNKRAGETVSLKPIPWTSGDFSVSAPNQTPVSGRPSLLGDNTGLVSMPLDRATFLLLSDALETGKHSPLSIVYKLGYESFSPSYGCSVEIDAQNFRDWVSRRCAANLVFINFESTETYASLRESSVIRISSVDFDPDGHEDFQRGLLASLRSLFEPLPGFGAPTNPDGGWGIGFSCSKISGTDFAARRASLRFDEATAKPRAIYLQGAIAGLVEAYRVRGVISVAASGDTTFRQHIAVSCYADYALDAIARISVTIRRKGETSSVGRHDFSAAAAAPWSVDLSRDPSRGASFERRFSVFFDDARPHLSSDWEDIGPTEAFVSIFPRTLYSMTRHKVFAGADFPWSLVSRVMVDILPPENSGTAPVSMTLSKDAPAQEAELFMAPPVAEDICSFRAVIVPNAGDDIDLGERMATGAILIEPFERSDVKFDATAIDWARIRKVGVAMKPGAGVLPSQSVAIYLTQSKPRGRYSSYRLPTAPRDLSLVLRYFKTDGSSERRCEQTSERIVKLSFS